MIQLTSAEKSLINDAMQKFQDEHPTWKIVFASVSGSHIYGTKDETVDSDIDIRGAYIVPTEDLLAIKGGYQQTFEQLNVIPLCDISFQEIGKFMRELLAPNMNYIEMVKSPIQIVEPPKKLVEIADACISKQLFNHIQGFSIHTWKHADKENWSKPKRILYLYRDMLRGIALFKGMPFASDVSELADYYQDEKICNDVDELIKLKKQGGKSSRHPHEENLKLLQDEMIRLKTFGTLKAEPILDHAVINKFIIEQRVKNFRSYKLNEEKNGVLGER